MRNRTLRKVRHGRLARSFHLGTGRLGYCGGGWLDCLEDVQPQAEVQAGFDTTAKGNTTMKTFWITFIVDEAIAVAQAFVGGSNLAPNIKAALESFIAAGQALLKELGV